VDIEQMIHANPDDAVGLRGHAGLGRRVHHRAVDDV
jgi:hypothetical protein